MVVVVVASLWRSLISHDIHDGVDDADGAYDDVDDAHQFDSC